MDRLRSNTPTRFSVVARDSQSGDEGDPQDLHFEIARDGQPATKYMLSRGNVKRGGQPGRFHVDLTLNTPGRYTYRWRAFGATVTSSQDVHVLIERPQFVG